MSPAAPPRTPGAVAAARLLRARRVLALATLGADGPSISMAPFAWLGGDDACLVIHVSHLAAHTRNLLADPRCAALVTASPDDPQVSPLALERLSIDAHAQFPPRDGPRWPAAAQAYRDRIADSAPLFEFGDFHIALLRPLKARMVSGFAQAHSFHGSLLAAAMAAGPTGDG